MNFKRLLKPILVILAILILTLSVSAGDLYSTYGQRIKLTIDHTKIDADLSWFPVTVFLTSSQMEEVFTEFDEDSDFDRIAFTTSDGETQLYADCELFDISESKAIYHVSKTGWTVSSSTDTDIYLYYSNIADHNTTYISKSGDTAAQSVWDSNFKAVYHMNDPDVTQTEAFSDNFEGGDLSNWTTAESNWSIDSSIKYTGNYSAKCLVSSTDRVLNKSLGNTYPYFKYDLYFRTNNASGTYYISHTPSYSLIARSGHFQYYDGSYKNLPVNTTVSAWTWYHIEIYGNADTNTLIYYIDGKYKGSHQDISFTGTNGYSSAGAATGGNIYLDNVNVYTYDSPAYGIIDSTSNANHGSKKGIGEPIEATGQVGQGQDFDGSDDYIAIPDFSLFDGLNDFTVEAIVNADSVPASDDWKNAPIILSFMGEGNYQITYDDSASNPDRLSSRANLSVSGWTTLVESTRQSIDTDYFHATTFDTTNGWVWYENGSSQDTNANTESFVSSSTTNYIGWIDSGTNRHFNGLLDEVRISSTARTTAWIAATYDSLWDTLLTYGDEETEEAGTTTNVLFIFSNF